MDTVVFFLSWRDFRPFYLIWKIVSRFTIHIRLLSLLSLKSTPSSFPLKWENVREKVLADDPRVFFLTTTPLLTCHRGTTPSDLSSSWWSHLSLLYVISGMFCFGALGTPFPSCRVVGILYHFWVTSTLYTASFLWAVTSFLLYVGHGSGTL